MLVMMFHSFFLRMQGTSSLPSIILATEASSDVGMGHAMRSMWVAKALTDQGFANVKLVMPQQQVINQLGNKWGVRIENPLTENDTDVLKYIYETVVVERPGLLVVDGISFVDNWIRSVRELDIPTVLIASGANLSSQVDGCVWPETCPKNLEISDRYICGESYLPLAPDYWNTPAKVYSESIKKVLVTFGGVDHYDASTTTIRAFDNCFDTQINIRVVAGTYYDNIDRIRHAAEKSHHKVEILIEPLGLHESLSWCDLVICAAGTTLFEACVTGTPSIGVAIWQAQQPTLERVAGKGSTLPVIYETGESLMIELMKHLSDLKKNPLKRASLGTAGQSFLDGYGARRIASWLQTFIK